MSRYFVTGGAGFIRQSRRLIPDDGHLITAYDNFSTGQHRHRKRRCGMSDFRLAEGTCSSAK